MLDTAVESLSRTGLTVGLDHISVEELIREAGVSRSAVYRRWPYKDLFFADLVAELAKNAVPSIVDEELAALKGVVAEHEDWLNTAGIAPRWWPSSSVNSPWSTSKSFTGRPGGEPTWRCRPRS